MLKSYDIFRVMRDVGISVVHARSLPTCGVSLSRNGYTLVLGSNYLNGDERVRRTILLHELAHVMRGDCVVIAKEHINKDLWNIAADATINATLDRDVIAALNGVLYEKLQETYPEELPDSYIPATGYIYSVLKEKEEQFKEQLKQLIQKLQSIDQLNADGEMSDEEASAQHAKTVLEIGKALQDNPELASALNGWRNIPGTRRHIGKLKPIAEPRVSAVLRKIRKCMSNMHGARVPRRTWMRPGRVEGLRGVIRRRQHHIMLALDVSGSMDFVREVSMGVSAWIAREHRVDTYVFADTLAKAPSLSSLPNVGCGTQFEPVMRCADKIRPDMLIMVTDGYAGDHWTPPSVPILWVLMKDHSKPKLRSGDYCIVVSEKKDASSA